jgi:hypothetical protein
MSEPSKPSDQTQSPSTPPPLPASSRLDWWLGRTPAQVEALQQEVAAAQKAPLWMRGCVVTICLALLVVTVIAWTWVVLVPTLGLLAIIGVHYLITGKVMAPPLPLWVHAAFFALLLLTVALLAAIR